MKRMATLTLFVILSLALVACGAAQEAAPTATPAPEPTATAVVEEPAPTEEAEEEAPEAQSITDIAVADGRFTTLVTALEAAGLAETLAAEGDYTVFAPTDDAFAALPEGTVESLLEDPEGALTGVLLYHVVEGAVPADTVVTLESATTLQGEPVSIEVRDGGVFLNGDVQVVTTDIQASNGIIHVVDAVLMPPS